MTFTGAKIRLPQPCDCIKRINKMRSYTLGMVMSQARRRGSMATCTHGTQSGLWGGTLSQLLSWWVDLSHHCEQRLQGC